MKKLIALFLALSLVGMITLATAETGRVGIAMPTKSSERWIHDGNNLKDGLEALGYTVDLQYAEDDVDAQIAQVENMLTRGVDALVIASIDGSTLTSVLKHAKDQGVVTIAYDRLLVNSPDVDYFATFDSIAIGELQATSLLTGLGVLDGAEGPFNVELFAGSLDDSNTPLYFEGAMNILKPYLDSGVLVVRSGQTQLSQCATEGWDSLKAQARMDNLVSAHYSSGETCDGVLAPYDGLSIGILSALKAVGYGSGDMSMPIVTGQDCEVTSVKSMIAGEQYSSIFNNTASLAKVAVDLTTQALSGGEVETNSYYNNGSIDVPAMAISAIIITIDNYEAELIDSGYISADALK
ncbi:MAG: sugar ABC transporter substrate-binding protein [Eubacteriales bacterium]|nr:sugar ABC transporter substrate-binding protein [Eubacteriales bacterium]